MFPTNALVHFIAILVILKNTNAFVTKNPVITLSPSSQASLPISHLSARPLKTSQLYASQLFDPASSQGAEMGRVKAKLTKIGMMAFVASMCVALPVTLFPAAVLHKANVISKTRKEKASLRIGQFCSRWLMRIIPFAKIDVVNDDASLLEEPAIWVCNHTSMLDIFVLLATDKKLRGKKKRPIKIIYWKDLEKNPVTGLLFKMCGFFPVEMEDNGNGKANQYKRASFKKLLKGIKEAFDEGFDIGILPEGQLNPSPEKGLQPIFSGAFTLARMSKRPIRMMGIHGLHKLWHGDENIGMTVTGRHVKIRAYPFGRTFENADEFVESFASVIGHFGAKGEDHPKWEDFLLSGKKNPEALEAAV